MKLEVQVIMSKPIQKLTDPQQLKVRQTVEAKRGLTSNISLLQVSTLAIHHWA